MPTPQPVEKQPKSMLTPTGGFLSGYTHTLNPYSGCAFACTYCYVRRMPVALFRGEPWGEWVDAKRFDPDAFRRELHRAKRKGPVAIFMSSATDPYQPAEYRLELTRALLTIMTENPPAFLFVQTRSPLVTRDTDLFLRFPEGQIRVSVTVETDREDIRRSFAPAAPPIQARLKALRRLAEAGVPTQAAVAPLLPCTADFAAVLRTVTDRVTVDTFALGDGSGGKRTKALGISRIHASLGYEDWYEEDKYKQFWEQLREHFDPDRLYLSKNGFTPG
ncbi:SPL family radical SAM protein [Paenibacillus thermotolerans]|uniref:SPL family radical SAM protein n=1 Tax=Paenibacillus thermotolerans TaxID=3027807 RepID=UPI0023678A07|nr:MULTISPECIES: radical SAM protein [unclassified Paenibacillus]